MWKKTITEKDLPEIKVKNTTNASGEVNGLESPVTDSLKQIGKLSSSQLSKYVPINSEYKGYVENGTNESDLGDTRWIHFYSLLGSFKSWHLSKFEWTGLPDEIDPLLLEDYLWSYGSIAIFEHKGNYIFSGYTVDKYDVYFQPIKITPIVPNQKIKFSSKTVGKDCAIIRNNYGSFYPNHWQLATLFKVWNLTQDIVNDYNELKNNSRLNIQRLLLGNDVEDDEYLNILEMLHTGIPALRFDTSSLEDVASGGTGNTKGLLNFEDRTQSYRENHDWKLHNLMRIIGMKHASNQDKKERNNTQETTSETHGGNAIIRTELKTRQRDIEALNLAFNWKVNVMIDKDFDDEISMSNDKNVVEPTNKEIGNE